MRMPCSVLQHRQNAGNPPRWLLLQNSDMQEAEGRRLAISRWAIPWKSVGPSATERMVQFLLSRFCSPLEPDTTPKHIFQDFAKILVSSRCAVEEAFQRDAKVFYVHDQQCKVWEFPVAGFPGPGPTTDEALRWGHCTDQSALKHARRGLVVDSWPLPTGPYGQKTVGVQGGRAKP